MEERKCSRTPGIFGLNHRVGETIVARMTGDTTIASGDWLRENRRQRGSCFEYSWIVEVGLTESLSFMPDRQ